MAGADATAFDAREDSDGSASEQSVRGVAGYVRHLADPTYHRLLNAEKPLRRIVPLLLFVFLAILAFGRFASVDQHRNLLMENMQTQLHFITELVERDMSALANASEAGLTQNALQNRLADILPARYLNDGRIVTVSDNTGKVVANAPFDADLNDQQLTALFGDVVLLTVMGRAARAQEIVLPGGGEAFAMHRPLPAPLGGLTVIQPIQPVLASWRTLLSVNVTLFVGTATILLVVLYAYYAQGARAREADVLSRKIQDRFNTALGRGRSGMWDWDLASGQIFWSKSMFELLGLEPRAHAMGFSEVAELINPEDIDLYLVANAVVSGEIDQIDHTFRMKHAEGRWIWLRARAQRLIDTEGNYHLIGLGIDVGEQRRLLDENYRKDARLQDAIENLSEAFVLWDANKRLITCNTKYQELHSVDRKIAQPGVDYDTFMDNAKTPRVVTELMRDTSHNPGGRSIEAQLEDGRWLQINERRTKDGGFVSVGTDITAIKLHENKLIDSEKRLMATVTDLQSTRHKLEVQAKQLVELAEKYAKEKNNAEAASQTKSDFLANISHELRTPLNAIIGFSQMMMKEMYGKLGSEKYREYSHDIFDSGSFLLNVINDVLDMSKIEAGRLELSPEVINLSATLDDALRFVAIDAEEKEISFDEEISAELQMVADRRAMTQVFINLLSNAVKFSNPGGKVQMRARKVGAHVTISIEDTGVGIPKRDLDRITRPFEQVENQFTKSHKGSGLGLAISKSLTEMHGGALRIRSRVGEGTIVSVRLPVGEIKSHDNDATEATNVSHAQPMHKEQQNEKELRKAS